MPLTSAGLNAAVAGITEQVTHFGLVNGSGTELAGGSYARQAVTWGACLLYTSPSPRDVEESRMPSSA